MYVAYVQFHLGEYQQHAEENGESLKESANLLVNMVAQCMTICYNSHLGSIAIGFDVQFHDEPVECRVDSDGSDRVHNFNDLVHQLCRTIYDQKFWHVIETKANNFPFQINLN